MTSVHETLIKTESVARAFFCPLRHDSKIGLMARSMLWDISLFLLFSRSSMLTGIEFAQTSDENWRTRVPSALRTARDCSVSWRRARNNGSYYTKSTFESGISSFINSRNNRALLSNDRIRGELVFFGPRDLWTVTHKPNKGTENNF